MGLYPDRIRQVERRMKECGPSLGELVHTYRVIRYFGRHQLLCPCGTGDTKQSTSRPRRAFACRFFSEMNSCALQPDEPSDAFTASAEEPRVAIHSVDEKQKANKENPGEFPETKGISGKRQFYWKRYFQNVGERTTSLCSRQYIIMDYLSCQGVRTPS